MFAIAYPKGFVLALSFAGVLVAILHGILPTAMVYAGRYHLGLKGQYRLTGGWLLLTVITLFFLLMIYDDIILHIST